jgi:hypothetical protein
MIAREYKALQTFTRNGRVFKEGSTLPVHAATWVDLREKQRAGLVSGGPAERAANAKAQRDALAKPVDAVAPKAKAATPAPKAPAVPPPAVSAAVSKGKPTGSRRTAA